MGIFNPSHADILRDQMYTLGNDPTPLPQEMPPTGNFSGNMIDADQLRSLLDMLKHLDATGARGQWEGYGEAYDPWQTQVQPTPTPGPFRTQVQPADILEQLRR